MNLVILASLFVLIFIVSSGIRRQNKLKKQTEQEFWSRERRSNQVRRKSLDDLDYIKIPLEDFPTHVMQEDPVVLECIDTVMSLTSQKVLNLSGYTNTDLKLEYGTANITQLTEYDQNYTILVRTLQKWADILLENGYAQEAAVLMEFAFSTRTDISRTYYALADYWISQGETFQVQRLIDAAEKLPTANHNAIVRRLKERCKDLP